MDTHWLILAILMTLVPIRLLHKGDDVEIMKNQKIACSKNLKVHVVKVGLLVNTQVKISCLDGKEKKVGLNKKMKDLVGNDRKVSKNSQSKGHDS